MHRRQFLGAVATSGLTATLAGSTATRAAVSLSMTTSRGAEANVVASEQTPATGSGPTTFQMACMTLPYAAFTIERALEGIKGAGYPYVAWGVTHKDAAGRLDERTVLCVLTHDPKFDVPLLEVALRLPGVAYVGAMGSRRTHEDRLARLREAGLAEEELARLSSPIGLDLGARTPEETAISIAAEVIALRWGGRGERLASLEGRIHHDVTL